MNMELAYKIQMLPATIRRDRGLCENQLLKSGWSVAALERDLTEAMSWATSHCVVQQQEKQRRARAARKAKIRGDDALDLMFQAAGIDPAEIPKRSL